MKLFILNLFTAICLLFSNNINSNTSKNIILVNLSNLDSKSIATEVNYRLKELLPEKSINVVIYKSPVQIPGSCKYNGRYRADKTIKYLNNKITKNDNSVLIGITNKDISCTVHGYYDYGVRGLSYPSLNTCVASNYRIHSSKYYAYTIIHEYLHTQGLNHCSDVNCIMSDGQNNYKFRNKLCSNCKKQLNH